MTKELTEIQKALLGALIAHVDWDNPRGMVEGIISHLSASGCVIVPREPTEDMALAGAIDLPDYDPCANDAASCYRAMIDAHLSALSDKEG
jgi:hypothetical protein